MTTTDQERAREAEGNARALREALEMIARYELSSPEEFRDIAREALALPADDEAKRIAEMAREERALYPERYAVPDDEAKRIRAEVIEECAKVAENYRGLDDVREPHYQIARAIRALAQPEQGGAT